MEQTGKALRLSQQGAQAIVEEVGAIVGQNINMMDPEGYVIASTDPERIGTLHEGARKIIREHLDELYVRDEEATFTSRPGLNLPVYQAGSIAGVIGITGRDEEATLTSRPGLNLPVYQAGSIAGVIGITGRYEDVAGYGQIVKKMVEILIRENVWQDERRMGQRVLNRFLEDWVLGSGLLQPRVLEERGFALGIDISVPRRVMVAGVRNFQEYASTASGQKLLEQAEGEAAFLAGAGCLVFRNAGRQIFLVQGASDRHMTQLAGRIRSCVQKKFGIGLVMGIDGRARDIHVAYGQANKAWRSAGMSKRDVMTYDSVTLELFTEDVAESVKAEYLRKVFKNCGYEELCQWMGLLEAYFSAEGSLKAASDAMHIHKNTLTYKLRKLEELTGYDVRVLSQSAVFYMAMVFFRDVKEMMQD